MKGSSQKFVQPSGKQTGVQQGNENVSMGEKQV